MKGYKVFNKNWTCRNMQYEVGETYEMEEEPVLCGKGFHFCERVQDCFNYYTFNTENKIAEVEAIGTIVTKGDKTATNKIVIIRELSWQEMLILANTGKRNTGINNSGDSNSGDRNSGYRNSGDSNSGNRNSGNRNSGDSNSGNRNSGDRNSGNRNSGDSNSGDYNSGHFNISDNNSGCFNLEIHTIKLFDKDSNITLQQFERSDAWRLLRRINYIPCKWIYLDDMTEEEKTNNPDCETLGGYLKNNDLTEVNQEWWNGLTEKERQIIMGIPNFDADKFEKIMGIKM